MSTTRFYKIPEKWQKVKGEKFFKWDTSGSEVTLVVVNGPETSSGQKHNSKGVQLIDAKTLMAKYLIGDYAEPVPAEEYEKNFNQVVNFLK